MIGSRAFFGTFDYEVLAVDLETRTVAWRYRHPEREFPFYSSAALAGGRVVVGGRDKIVHAIDPDTGRAAWTFTAQARVDSSPAVAGSQIFVGSKGYLGTNGRGEGLGLLPGERWAAYSGTPRVLTRSPGHYRDWLRACKGGDPACSNFAVAGPYTEWVSLGAIALRVPGKLMWDAQNLRFTGPNAEEANKYVRPYERQGWEMKL